MIVFLSCAHGAQLKVLLRYDDYSNLSRAETEQALFAAAAELKAGVLVGVIPFPGGSYPDQAQGKDSAPLALKDEKIDLLRQYAATGVIAVGVHGFLHRNNATVDRPSEFVGLPSERQELLLRTAKSSLERATGARVRAFIPPFNTYDETTLRGLTNTGFTLLSAGFDGPLPQKASGVGYLPGGPYPQKLRQVVAAAVERGHVDAILVTTIHPYDIKGSLYGLPPFRRNDAQLSVDELIGTLRNIGKSEKVRFASAEELLTEDLSRGRAEANLRWRDSLVTRHRLLPEAADAYPLPGLYYSEQSANRYYRYEIALFFLIYGGILIGAAAISKVGLQFLSRRWPTLKVAAMAIALLGALTILGLSAVNGIYLKGAVLLACCCGLLAGSVLATRARRSSA